MTLSMGDDNGGHRASCRQRASDPDDGAPARHHGPTDRGDSRRGDAAASLPTNGLSPAAHTASGKPLLANDPHLELNAPVLWYLASIVAPDLEVTGVTAPGVPAVVLGHNKRIAWGMTTTSSDTMDLFVEKTDGDGYVTPDGTKPFGERDEMIKVRGGPAVTIKVRTTRHGPVVTDILGEDAGGQICRCRPRSCSPTTSPPRRSWKSTGPRIGTTS